MITAVTGSNLTINVVAINTTFASVFYGTDVNGPINALKAVGDTSVTIKVLAGDNPITMNFISPVYQDQLALYRGDPTAGMLITAFNVQGGTATYAPSVVGSSPAIAAPPAKV